MYIIKFKFHDTVITLYIVLFIVKKAERGKKVNISIDLII